MLKLIIHSKTFILSVISLIFTFIPEDIFGKYGLYFNKLPYDINVIVNHVLLAIIITILCITLNAIYYHLRQSVTIKGKNYSIKIEYNNIFKMENCKKIIPFDECYTTDVGQLPHQIKPNSICGQYLEREHIENIQKLITNVGLKPAKGKSKYQNKEKYPSGSLVPNNEYLLMAFVKLDERGAGRMSRDEYMDCLLKLWSEIDNHYAQGDVCVPILGSGITRINDTSLTQQELLDIMIESYKLSTHKIKLPYKLHIVCKKREGFSLNKIGDNI